MALLREASEYYSNLLGIPIEISSRKIRDYAKEIKPDKLIIQVPNAFNPLATPTDYIDEGRHETFDKWLAALADKLSHIYAKEMKEINSSSTLKSSVSSWASNMGIPSPRGFSLREADSKWGSVVIYTNASYRLMLHDFLRYVPLDIAEEVIVHELCHVLTFYNLIEIHGLDKALSILSVRNPHDSEFWRVLSSYMSDYQDRANILDRLYEDMMGGKTPTNG